MVKAVSRICPLDSMMKYAKFQAKKRLSYEVLKVTDFHKSYMLPCIFKPKKLIF